MYFHLLIEVVVSWLEYVSELHSPISLVTQLLYYQLSDGLRLVLENLFRNWQVDSANKLIESRCGVTDSTDVRFKSHHPLVYS
jgi:hypothetical protein